MNILPIGLALVSGVLLGYGIQDKKDKPAAPAAQDGGMQMPKPGPEHDLLKKFCGEWDAVVHAEGKTSKGIMTTRAHSDFFTVDDFKGEFMGMPFTGHGINGYDPLKKQFVTVWIDSMGPAPLILWGSHDAKKKEMVMTGEGVGMDNKPCKMTTITRHKDDDHCEFVMMAPGPDGKDAEMVKIEYARKKK